MLVRFEGVTVREQAAELTNGELWAEREALPDPGPGTAYTFQLLGLRVETEAGRSLGAIAEVISTGAHPVYMVRGERELLVPGAPGVVKRVDLGAGLMVVALPAGLEEL
jgi:16S rRNA processing protein RimM